MNGVSPRLYSWERFRTKIDEAEKAFEEGDLDRLRELLPPLLERNIPAAIRMNASFFEPGVPEEDIDRLHVEGMFEAAKLGDSEAKYRVGVFYDLGEYGIPQDKLKASNIFKDLAEQGDPHCMWIYACELLWGNGSFEKATDEGLKILHEAARLGSADACITLAGFHDAGKFGHEISIEKRDEYRALAFEYDDTTFDPYA